MATISHKKQARYTCIELLVFGIIATGMVLATVPYGITVGRMTVDWYHLLWVTIIVFPVATFLIFKFAGYKASKNFWVQFIMLVLIMIVVLFVGWYVSQAFDISTQVLIGVGMIVTSIVAIFNS